MGDAFRLVAELRFEGNGKAPFGCDVCSEPTVSNRPYTIAMMNIKPKVVTALDGLTWTLAKRMRGGRLLQSSYFWLFALPPIAHFLGRLPHEIDIPVGEVTIPLTIGLPFSWKLFYLAAVAYSISSLYFATRCPTLIRECDHFADYDAIGGSDSRILVEMTELIRTQNDPSLLISLTSFAEGFLNNAYNVEILKKLNAHQRWEADPQVKLNAARKMWLGSIQSLLHQNALRPGALNDSFTFVHNLWDKSNRISLILCVAFCAISYFLYALVACQGFYFVCKVILR
jgi:hypothetical protein